MILWDTKTNMIISTLEGHKAAVLSLAFAPKGTKLASGS